LLFAQVGQQRALALFGRIQQTAVHARLAGDGRQCQGWEGIHFVGVGISRRDDLNVRARIADRPAHLLQKDERILSGLGAEQPHLDVLHAARGRAQRRQGHRARQVGYVPDRRADRDGQGGTFSHTLDHVRKIGSQCPLARVLDVNNVRAALQGGGDFGLAGDADQ